MMAWATNAFTNNSSSILQQKFQGAIQDQLSSPASPLELLLAFSLGGFMRGLIVAVLTFVAASLLVDLPVDHILVLIPALFLVGFFFSQLGVLIGVRAEQFDDVAFAQTFVLQPLIFLGGVFYSAALLPQPFETLTHFNPIYYMINLVRYGFVGYTEVSIPLSLLALTAGHRGALRRQPAPLLARLQAARVAQPTRTCAGRPRQAAIAQAALRALRRSSRLSTIAWPMATRIRRRRRKPHKSRWHKIAIPIVVVVAAARGRRRQSPPPGRSTSTTRRRRSRA